MGQTPFFPPKADQPLAEIRKSPKDEKGVCPIFSVSML